MNKPTKPVCYEIHIGGELSETMLGAFPKLRGRVHGPVTVLTGELPDQSALHGVLAQVEALNLELLEVQRREPTAPQRSGEPVLSAEEGNGPRHDR